MHKLPATSDPSHVLPAAVWSQKQLDVEVWDIGGEMAAPKHPRENSDRAAGSVPTPIRLPKRQGRTALVSWTCPNRPDAVLIAVKIANN